MSGEITVNPGRTWTDDEAITAAKLNQTAAPTAQVDAASIGSRELITADVQALAAAAARAQNMVATGDFRKSRFIDVSGVSCAVADLTQVCRPWAVRPAGAIVTGRRSTSVPTNGLTGDSLEIVGAAGATTVELVQWIPSHQAAKLDDGDVTLSVQVYNNTGAAFSPKLKLYVADTEDGTVRSLASTTNMDACPNASWTALTETVDASGVPNLKRGFELAIEVPSGALDSGGKTVRFAQAQLEIASAGTTFIQAAEDEPVRHNLAGSGTPAVTDDESKGYGLGSFWLDQSTPQLWVCTDPETGAAVWKQCITPEMTVTRDVVVLQDQKAAGTAAGAASATTWQTRDLNTEVVDTAAICSLASNRFTLDPGTYEIEAVVPGYRCNGHQAILWDYTNSATILKGTSARADSGEQVTTHSFVKGRFTIAAPTEYEIKHYTQSARAGDGLGEALNASDPGDGAPGEVYTLVRIVRTAT